MSAVLCKTLPHLCVCVFCVYVYAQVHICGIQYSAI